MGKKSFYLIMTIVSLVFFTFIALALICIMPCTRINAVIVLAVSSFGGLLTLCWYDNFVKARK
jgi:hypothetical protein